MTLFRSLFPSFEKPVDRQRYLNLEPETHEFRGVGTVLLLAASCGVALALWEPSQQVTTPFATASASRSAPPVAGKPVPQETTAVADATEDEAPTVKLSTACSQRATARRDCASVRALKDARVNGDPAPAASKDTKASAAKAAAKKPSAAETKTAVVEAKPAAVEAKPAVAETKPAVAESKPAAVESKAAVAETKPAVTEGTSATAETKPAAVETKAAVAEAKPAAVEAKPTPAEAKPAAVAARSAPAEPRQAAVAARAPNPDPDSVAPAATPRGGLFPLVTQPEAPAAQPQKTAAAPKAKRQRSVPEDVERYVREAPVERLVKVYEQVMPDGRRVPVYRRVGSGSYETGVIVDGEYRPARRANLDPPSVRYFGLQ
jgi:hypothetical protein